MREIYLIIYHSPLFPAHWALWIPLPSDSDRGKRVHVTGDAAGGFAHEFSRNYRRSEDSRRHSVVLLGEVPDEWVVDDSPGPENAVDTEPQDELERVALGVPAPGKTLRVARGASSGRAQILNCQSWIHEYVAALEKAGAGTGLVDAIRVARVN
ncbi:hypothetical protein C8J57DRAFT_517703 [Mycena rebaudengoi]|nr:hypothetical protein C8J57DRAFT_517703 [Mycena rebaudengoi]